MAEFFQFNSNCMSVIFNIRKSFLFYLTAIRPGGGTPIWNRQGCSSEIFNLTPKGDHLGVAQAFCNRQRGVA